MSKASEPDRFFTFAPGLKQWTEDLVASDGMLIQLAVVLAIMLATWMLARFLSLRVGGRLLQWRNRNLPMLASRFHLSTREMFFLILASSLLWFASMIASAAQLPFGVLNVAASLVSAWAVIRFGSCVVKSQFWARILAVVVWVVAALNMIGWLDAVVDVLDKAEIPVGQNHLSILLILKGACALAVLLWLAGRASEVMERALWHSHLTPSQKVLFHKLAKIVFVGTALLLGLNVVGIDLTALAVFSGALGIGIGFGLQKVFANLMSGFILLMDKSIKPGDVIAIADTYGWVNRLGARYVSVLTRDGKEHLIPNETLITQPVENWSYTDGKIRIHVPVGVSYQSDVPLVKKLLLEVASNHPRILKNPAPACLVKGFGDNAINFELRAWIEDPVNGVSNVMSGVYEEVWRVFKENHINIPFPQRDTHFDMEQIKEIIRMMKHGDA